MSDSIRLSPKHGVNPSLALCVACGKDHSVILFGRLVGDTEAPRRVLDGFCNECESVVKQGGVILVECRDGSGKDPYRTGRVWGITGEAFDRLFHGVQRPGVPGRPPVCYIEESAARKIGLPDHTDR
jgi:hypothetical protein